jgi:hypothetical protein
MTKLTGSRNWLTYNQTIKNAAFVILISLQIQYIKLWFSACHQNRWQDGTEKREKY